MELQELIRRSNASRKARNVSVDLYAICTKVKYRPDQTAYWHYGNSLQRSYYYAAFERARKHGLIWADHPSTWRTTYKITERGEEFLRRYNGE